MIKTRVITMKEFQNRFMNHIPTKVVDMTTGKEVCAYGVKIPLSKDWTLDDDTKEVRSARVAEWNEWFSKYRIAQGDYQFKTNAQGEQVYSKAGYPIKEIKTPHTDPSVSKRFKFKIKEFVVEEKGEEA